MCGTLPARRVRPDTLQSHPGATAASLPSGMALAAAGRVQERTEPMTLLNQPDRSKGVAEFESSEDAPRSRTDVAHTQRVFGHTLLGSVRSTRPLARLALALALAGGASGCREKPERDPARVGGPAALDRVPAPPPGAPGSPGRPPEPRVDAPDTEVPAPPPRSALKYADAMVRFAAWRAKAVAPDDDGRKAFQLAMGKLRSFRRIIVDAYAKRDHRPFTSHGLELTKDGRLAADLVLDVASHGLEPSPYPVQSLRDALARYDAARVALEAARQAPDPATVLGRLVVVSNAVVQKPDEPYYDLKLRYQKALLSRDLDDTGPIDEDVSALYAWARRAREAREPVRRALRDVDLLVVQGFLQYALDFKLLVVAQPYDALTADARAVAPRIFKKQLAETLEAAGDHLGRAMRAMWPSHPFYEKARKALARYRALARDPSFPAWSGKRRLRKGAKGAPVLELKKRLAAEGFYAGDVTEAHFGPDLEAAVRKYQRHHQLDEDGIVQDKRRRAEALTSTSIRVSMRARARQIALSLQRWRESEVGHLPKDAFYFRVNIPQFEVEVWDKQHIARTHRVIVGSNKYVVDEAIGRKGNLNRTALLSNRVRTVVFNPVWHVPKRIKLGELDREAEKDPTYWEKHNYRLRTLEDGTEVVAQMPGSGNALGRVKLLFPNRHSIYMHDTPKKRLFSKTLRAFSHGCMRLQDPVEMAAFLLERDGRLTRAEIDGMLKAGKERGIRLKEPVPIYVEYNTVGFREDSDLPIFLNDPYGYDRAFARGELPLKPFERIPIKEPEPKPPKGETADGPSPEKPPFPEDLPRDGARKAKSPAPSVPARAVPVAPTPTRAGPAKAGPAGSPPGKIPHGTAGGPPPR